MAKPAKPEIGQYLAPSPGLSYSGHYFGSYCMIRTFFVLVPNILRIHCYITVRDFSTKLLLCQLDYLISGHHTEVCDGVVVSLYQPSLEGQVALAPPTSVEVGRSSTNREG